jgi:hypothetical protein
MLRQIAEITRKTKTFVRRQKLHGQIAANLVELML